MIHVHYFLQVLKIVWALLARGCRCLYSPSCREGSFSETGGSKPRLPHTVLWRIGSMVLAKAVRNCPKRGQSNTSTVDLASLRTPKRTKSTISVSRKATL